MVLKLSSVVVTGCKQQAQGGVDSDLGPKPKEITQKNKGKGGNASTGA
jgi:hypothetical protein